MILKIIYMFFSGFVQIDVEGFFIERFLNICKNKGIFLENLSRKNSTYISIKILKSDFKKVAKIAKSAKCKIKIQKKSGVPFFINKYRKRKVFAIALVVIAIFIFSLSRFIWNIEVFGNEEITKEDVINLVKENGIYPGKFKENINVDKISNNIRLTRDDISWIGITIKGTNAIICIEEASEAPEIIEKDKISDIYASKDSVISKITVQNGTAKKAVGEEVKKGELIVEGVMLSGDEIIKYVNSDATILGSFLIEKQLKENFVQNENIKTGKKETKREICINNFKINFNKGVSKFENYDTITLNKKVRLFSNFYFPFEFRKTINFETRKNEKIYSKEELQEKITAKIEEDLEKEYEISKYKEKNKKVDVFEEDDGLIVKITYEICEDIGIEKNRE